LSKDFITPDFSATNILLVPSWGDCKSNGFEKVKLEKALFSTMESSTIGISTKSSLPLHDIAKR
jgi:hypothetical protein